MGLLDQFLTQHVDPVKRRLRGLLTDPAATLEQTAYNAVEQRLPGFADAAEAQSVMPQIAGPALGKFKDLGLNVGLATVFHGSPHRFDKFDASKIGTGEGAQAYGHGLYFAENPGTARSYMPSGLTIDVDMKNIPQSLDSAHSAAYASILNAKGDLASAKQSLLNQARIFKRDAVAKPDDAEALLTKALWREQGAKLIDEGRYKISNNGAGFYKVDLPDDAIAKMLDWDAPLSKQPKGVREIANLFSKDEVRQMTPRLGGKQAPEPSGRDIYDALTKKFGGNQRVTSAYLRDSLGIPGIKYLDAGSRGAGTGTRNFVVFPGNEGLLKILERE